MVFIFSSGSSSWKIGKKVSAHINEKVFQMSLNPVTKCGLRIDRHFRLKSSRDVRTSGHVFDRSNVIRCRRGSARTRVKSGKKASLLRCCIHAEVSNLWPELINVTISKHDSSIIGISVCTYK